MEEYVLKVSSEGFTCDATFYPEYLDYEVSCPTFSTSGEVVAWLKEMENE